MATSLGDLEKRLAAVENRLAELTSAVNSKQPKSLKAKARVKSNPAPKEKIKVTMRMLRDGGTRFLMTKDNVVYRYDGKLSSKTRGTIFLDDKKTKLTLNDFEIVEKF